MSFEKVLIIRQHRDSHVVDCKNGLELSPEQYTVAIADSYVEGRIMLRDKSVIEAERFRLVMIDTDDVDSYTLELLENLRGSDSFMPVIVMTTSAESKTRQSLTAMSCECVIKTGEYYKYIWQVVKRSLERNSNRVNRTGIKTNKAMRTFVVGKKKA
jgi:DNA-binding NtrC family response regulator